VSVEVWQVLLLLVPQSFSVPVCVCAVLIARARPALSAPVLGLVVVVVQPTGGELQRPDVHPAVRHHQHHWAPAHVPVLRRSPHECVRGPAPSEVLRGGEHNHVGHGAHIPRRVCGCGHPRCGTQAAQFARCRQRVKPALCSVAATHVRCCPSLSLGSLRLWGLAPLHSFMVAHVWCMCVCLLPSVRNVLPPPHTHTLPHSPSHPTLPYC
jgi:hypothetical protein